MTKLAKNNPHGTANIADDRMLASDERVRMTDAEILQIDFYDLLGTWAVWYTPEEKVKYYRELTGDV